MTVADFGALMVVADGLDVTATQYQEWAESIRNLAFEILHDTNPPVKVRRDGCDRDRYR